MDYKRNMDLFASIAGGDVEHAQRLIHGGADVNSLSAGDSGDPALAVAVRSGRIEMVKMLLLEKAKPNKKSSDGIAPLSYAAAYGHVDMIPLLISQGADVNITNPGGFTPLHEAAQQGHAIVASMLLASGASIESVASHQLRPLHLAAQNGHLAVANLLIEHGAVVSAEMDEGYTAFQIARINGHGEICLLLSEAGGQPEKKRPAAIVEPSAEKKLKEAREIEWDDGAIRVVFEMHCQCGGRYRMIRYLRESVQGSTVDTIECQCLRCSSTRYVSFKPFKIHRSVSELLQKNRQFVRI